MRLNRRSFEEKRREAVRWFEVPRLAERERRRREDEPLLRAHDADTESSAGAGESRCGASPRCRSSGPATFDPERGDDGDGRRR